MHDVETLRRERNKGNFDVKLTRLRAKIGGLLTPAPWSEWDVPHNAGQKVTRRQQRRTRVQQRSREIGARRPVAVPFGISAEHLHIDHGTGRGNAYVTLKETAIRHRAGRPLRPIVNSEERRVDLSVRYQDLQEPARPIRSLTEADIAMGVTQNMLHWQPASLSSHIGLSFGPDGRLVGATYDEFSGAFQHDAEYPGKYPSMEYWYGHLILDRADEILDFGFRTVSDETRPIHT